MSTHTTDNPSAPETRKKSSRRGLFLFLLLLFVAALLASTWWLVARGKSPSNAATPAAGAPFGGQASAFMTVTVGVGQAQQGQLPILINALGTVTPAASVVLVPQVSGTLTEILFDEGQPVAKGQVLAHIDARSYRQKLAQAKGQLARDEAELAQARVTLQRYQTLLRQDSIARQDVDAQSALVHQLEAVVQADKASVQAAQLDVEFTEITAPIEGIIGLRAVDVGNLVGPSTTAGIATITQIEPIDVVFSIPQDDVHRLRQALFQGELPVQALDRTRARVLAEGVFLTLDNQINASSGTVRAKARFDNAQGNLYPSQFVNVRLQLGVNEGILVPITAVRTGPEGAYVYVIDDEQHAHMRAVTVDSQSDDQVLIAEGLQDGEQVVTEGGDRVKDGGSVRLPGQSTGPAPRAPESGR